MTTKTQPQLMEAISTFAVDNTVIRVGTRVSADDPIVKRVPKAFVVADLSDAAKRKAAADHLYGPRMAAARERAVPPPPPPPAPRIGAMEATGTYTVEDGTGGSRIVNPGDRFPIDHPIVRRYSHIFRPLVEQR